MSAFLFKLTLPEAESDRFAVLFPILIQQVNIYCACAWSILYTTKVISKWKSEANRVFAVLSLWNFPLECILDIKIRDYKIEWNALLNLCLNIFFVGFKELFYLYEEIHLKGLKSFILSKLKFRNFEGSWTTDHNSRLSPISIGFNLNLVRSLSFLLNSSEVLELTTYRVVMSSAALFYCSYT